MSTKKNHHIIPKVYLKEFVDSKPKDFPIDKPFTAFFWQLDKSFELAPKPKSPKKGFGKNKFYKLDSDTNEYQIIEEFLSKIEGGYKDVLEKLKSKTPLTSQNIIDLIIFTETLHQRTEIQVGHWQSQFNKLEDIYREVDQHHNNNQKYSDEMWKGSHELGKKLIIDGIGAMGQLLINEGIYLLFNESEMSFVSSDNPVLWTFKHIDELKKLYVPSDWLREEIKINQKSFFCYFPLTPTIALFSSPLLKSLKKQKYQYWETEYLQFVLSMNFLTHISAESIIISNKLNPYGVYETRIKTYLETIKSVQQIKGKKLLFYTSESRYWLEVEDYERSEDFPTKIRFWTNDIETLKLIAKDEFIEIVHFYKDGKDRGFSRNLIFEKVNLSKEEPSILIFKM